jgi:hypothetical protein
LTTFGINAPTPGAHFLSDVGHGLQTLPGMLAIMTAVVAGAWAALVGVALGADKAVAIAIGAVIFLLTLVAHGLFARRAVMGYAGSHEPKFPSPAEKDGEAS